MNVAWHPGAESDVTEAARFYSAQVTGLGNDFLDSVDTAIQDIATDPLRFAPIGGSVRLYLIKRFPYGIYFRVTGDSLRVLAVKHHRRSAYWKGRR